MYALSLFNPFHIWLQCQVRRCRSGCRGRWYAPSSASMPKGLPRHMLLHGKVYTLEFSKYTENGDYTDHPHGVQSNVTKYWLFLCSTNMVFAHTHAWNVKMSAIRSGIGIGRNVMSDNTARCRALQVELSKDDFGHDHWMQESNEMPSTDMVKCIRLMWRKSQLLWFIVMIHSHMNFGKNDAFQALSKQR